MSDEAQLRAAIRLTIDCIQQLSDHASWQWTSLVRRLIGDLRALRLHDASALWALLAVANEQVRERCGTRSPMNGGTSPASAMPADMNAEKVLDSFERDIDALAASAGASNR